MLMLFVASTASASAKQVNDPDISVTVPEDCAFPIVNGIPILSDICSNVQTNSPLPGPGGFKIVGFDLAESAFEVPCMSTKCMDAEPPTRNYIPPSQRMSMLEVKQTLESIGMACDIRTGYMFCGITDQW